MIIWLFEYFKVFDEFNICCRVVFRAFFSFLSAFLIFFGIGPYFIDALKRLRVCEVIRDIGPKMHFVKQGTPVMGGGLILFSIICSILLWGDLCNRYIWYVVFILISYGVIGFIDDYYKVFKKYNRGLNILFKYFFLSVVALLLIVVIFVLERHVIGTQLVIPGFNNLDFQLGGWYILLGYLVIIGSGNGVNLSDGLDGLVIFPVVCISFGLGLIAWMVSDLYFSGYAKLQYCLPVRELVIVSGSIMGSGLGFLWFNTYPAQIFMGDVGSLSLGGALGVLAVLLRQELLLAIMGGVFVLETLSVVFQICSVKCLGHRIFRMAPIHHHFELKEVPEPRIVVRCWIITLILVIIGLMIFQVH